MVTDITKAADQLASISNTTQEHAATMEQNTSITESNASAAEELAASAVEMSEQAQELQKLVGQFRVSGSSQVKAFDTRPVKENRSNDIKLHEHKNMAPVVKFKKPVVIKRLAWDDAYSSGVKDVDDQHKKLFEMMNAFGEDIKNGRAAESFDETMKFLGDYVRFHFGFEEDCMNRFNCPAHQKNKEAHAGFMELFKKFAQRAGTEDKETLSLEIHEAAANWLVKHVCGIDVQLKHCVKKERQVND